MTVNGKHIKVDSMTFVLKETEVGKTAWKLKEIDTESDHLKKR